MLLFFRLTRAQAAGYLEHHVFFTRFVFAYRAGVFAAVSRIKHNDNGTVVPRFTGLRARFAKAAPVYP